MKTNALKASMIWGCICLPADSPHHSRYLSSICAFCSQLYPIPGHQQLYNYISLNWMWRIQYKLHTQDRLPHRWGLCYLLPPAHGGLVTLGGQRRYLEAEVIPWTPWLRLLGRRNQFEGLRPNSWKQTRSGTLSTFIHNPEWCLSYNMYPPSLWKLLSKALKPTVRLAV